MLRRGKFKICEGACIKYVTEKILNLTTYSGKRRASKKTSQKRTKMIPYSRQQITDSDIAAVVSALKDDILTGGDKVGEFEEAIARYVGVKHVVAMNSATSALHVAYLALGVREGDEVVTTPITFSATANAALMAGAEVKFAPVK